MSRARVRSLPWRTAVLTLSAAALSVGVSGVAYASPPGDNGTVKIHAVGTSTVDHRNQPHVCVFYLDAFGFDSPQFVSWTILQHPPTGHDKAKSGQIVLADGSGRTDNIQLPDGHYKLFWNFDGEHGRAKHKVFWVKCKDTSPSPSTSAGAPPVSTSPSALPSVSPSGGVVLNPSTSPSAGEVGNTPAPSPSNVSEGGSLPVTGAPLAAIVAAAAALIGAGILMRARLSRLFRRS